MHTNIVWTGGDARRRRPTHQPQKDGASVSFELLEDDTPLSPERPAATRAQ